jgi:putative ABC transport system ATP-binding protein
MLGKSTLLNAVAGGFLLDAGKLILAGNDVTTWPEHRRAARRGQPRGLGPALRRSAVDEFRERVHRLNMGLAEQLDESAAEMLQRLYV